MEEHRKRLIDFLHFELTQEENLAFEREDGFEEGAADMQNRLNKLTVALLEANRIDDLKRAAADTDFQQRLL